MIIINIRMFLALFLILFQLSSSLSSFFFLFCLYFCNIMVIAIIKHIFITIIIIVGLVRFISFPLGSCRFIYSCKYTVFITLKQMCICIGATNTFLFSNKIPCYLLVLLHIRSIIFPTDLWTSSPCSVQLGPEPQYLYISCVLSYGLQLSSKSWANRY